MNADPCSSCERPHSIDRPVIWSHAFTALLCDFCRESRIAAELGATTRANAAARLVSGETAA
jgi:hypothetical protein